MPDVVDAATRSRMMSGIRGTNTKPEMMIRRLLHAAGFRYRLHVRALPGCPDLVLPRYRVVIFVHGCFWHAHEGCRYFKIPQTRAPFWRAKLEGNQRRDRASVDKCLDLGWRVGVVWECATRQRDLDVTQLADWIRGTDATYESPTPGRQRVLGADRHHGPPVVEGR